MKFAYRGKVLLLSASIGDGHNQVARAMSESIKDYLPLLEPVTVDLTTLIHPAFSKISTFMYKQSIKKLPQLYGYLYRKTRIQSTFSTKLHSFFIMGGHSILELIQAIKPVAIISTHPFAAGMISKLKEEGSVGIPAITIITDYGDHSYWVHPCTDQYIVATQQLKRKLIDIGIEAYKIQATGIPLKRGFSKRVSKQGVCGKYGLSPHKFTLLVMGGGDGFFPKEAFQQLETLSTPIQLMIVCGKNDKLKDSLQRAFAYSKHDVRIMGYMDNIHELMAISNLVMTKPGGVTMSEAIAMGAPLLVSSPLPGQEQDNSLFIEQSGIGLLVNNSTEIIDQLKKVLLNPQILTTIQQNMIKHQTKFAAMDTIKVTMQLMKHAKTEKIG